MMTMPTPTPYVNQATHDKFTQDYTAQPMHNPSPNPNGLRRPRRPPHNNGMAWSNGQGQGHFTMNMQDNGDYYDEDEGMQMPPMKRRRFQAPVVEDLDTPLLDRIGGPSLRQRVGISSSVSGSRPQRGGYAHGRENRGYDGRDEWGGTSGGGGMMMQGDGQYDSGENRWDGNGDGFNRGYGEGNFRGRGYGRGGGRGRGRGQRPYIKKEWD